MRFGQTLRGAVYAPWKDNYLDYQKLKKLLRDDDSATSSPSGDKDASWTDDDAEKFYDELANVQLEKVQNFHRETYQKLRDRTAKCEAKLDPIAISGRSHEAAGDTEGGAEQSNGSGKKPEPSDEGKSKILKEVSSELDDITKEVSELEKYSRINYTGFLKIAKKHDRKRGGRINVRAPLQSLLVKVPFNKEDYSPLLYRVSAMYAFIRQQQEGKPAGSSMTESQTGGDTYTAHKFWIHPDNLLEVKTNILRRLPVLVYNPSESKVAEASQRDPTLTSIYFDNPDFDLYEGKVEHDRTAQSLRLRWYGQLSQKPEIVIEKKTIGTDNVSSEQRFAIKEKYIQRFLKGDYHMEKQLEKVAERAGKDSDAYQNLKKAIDDVSAFIKEKQLQPVIRANYTRTAFQIPGDSRVRVSLDTNVAFIREDAIDTERPVRDPDDWHRKDVDDAGLEYPFKSIRKGEVSRFPFGILEIKIKGTRKSEWLEDLMHSHLLREAPRFSKFVHGVAELFEDNVNTLPFWLSALDEDIRQAPEDAFKEEQAKRQKQAEDEIAVGSFIGKSLMSKSPHRKMSTISPSGSPTLKSPAPASRTKRHSLAEALSTTPAKAIDQAATGEEPDSDEDDDPSATAAETSRGLTSLFPGWSSSKYAQRKRQTKDAPLPPGVAKPDYWIKDQGPVKVEAKVWMANQRTFVKWQHVSVLLATLSLGLFNAAGADNNVARALGVLYTALAVFIGAWGWGVYVWRAKLIEGRSGQDFDALTGPIATCVGLILALVLNFAFKYNDLMQKQAGSDRLETLVRFDPTLDARQTVL